MRLVSHLLCALITSLAVLSSPAMAHDGQLDQASPYANAWLFCDDPANVWQQQVQVGIGGRLDRFEFVVRGDLGDQIDFRLRVGDGWSVGPEVWSGTFTKTSEYGETGTMSVDEANILLGPGETLVIEARGISGAPDLSGSWVGPGVGPPHYSEPLFLNGPGCYQDCGVRMGFRTWMSTDLARNYCVATPNSAGNGAIASVSGSFSAAANDLVLHAGPAPAGSHGLFFYGGAKRAIPFGDGILCVAGGGMGISRQPISAVDGAGVLTTMFDALAPRPAQLQILPGSTWYFQGWFRDGAAGGTGFNVSDGLEISWLP